MIATDLDSLHPPEAMVEELRTSSRASVLKLPITVDVDWWNTRISDRDLSGGPIHSADGHTLTRADVFAGRGDPFRLLWLSLVWGAGNRRRLCEKRIDSVVRLGDTAIELLATAASQAPTDPVAAFRTLAPGGKPAIKFLGAAFLTKYLYFASGSEAAAPTALILDSRVAASLRNHGWESLRTSGGWQALTYERYLGLVKRWCCECGAALERQVAGDEVEHWLFEAAA